MERSRQLVSVAQPISVSDSLGTGEGYGYGNDTPMGLGGDLFSFEDLSVGGPGDGLLPLSHGESSMGDGGTGSGSLPFSAGGGPGPQSLPLTHSTVVVSVRLYRSGGDHVLVLVSYRNSVGSWFPGEAIVVTAASPLPSFAIGYCLRHMGGAKGAEVILCVPPSLARLIATSGAHVQSVPLYTAITRLRSEARQRNERTWVVGGEFRAEPGVLERLREGGLSVQDDDVSRSEVADGYERVREQRSDPDDGPVTLWTFLPRAIHNELKSHMESAPGTNTPITPSR